MHERKLAQIEGEDEGIEDTLFPLSAVGATDHEGKEDVNAHENENENTVDLYGHSDSIVSDDVPGLARVFGNFEVTLVPKGYAAKAEAQEKSKVASRRRRIAAAKRKQEFARRRAEEEGNEAGIAAALSASACIDEAVKQEKEKEVEAMARKARGAKPRVEGTVDWRRSSPPGEIRKRVANAVGVTGDVDDSKWLIGNSLSLKEADTQGIDPLLNVAKHVGYYAGIALSNDAREMRFKMAQEDAANRGDLDHPEELMEWGATASYRRNHPTPQKVQASANREPLGDFGKVEGTCGDPTTGKHQSPPLELCAEEEGNTLKTKDEASDTTEDVEITTTYQPPKTAPSGVCRRNHQLSATREAPSTAVDDAAVDYEQSIDNTATDSLPPLSPPPRSAPGMRRQHSASPPTNEKKRGPNMTAGLQLHMRDALL